MTAARTPGAPARPRARRGEGDKLRDDLLAATERLMIESGGADSVSIRAIADAVGVTPPSIYLHFPDKEALIVAVCERHFEVFDSVIERAGATVDDPVESLRRRGRAYVRFGLDNPAPYRILFMSRIGGDRRLEVITGAGGRAFQHLVDGVQRAIESGDLRPVAPVFAATALWTAVHGITSLLISLPDFPWPDVDALVDHVCDIQIRGLREPVHEPKESS
jgi:AcrR family transcriptional regulator